MSTFGLLAAIAFMSSFVLAPRATAFASQDQTRSVDGLFIRTFGSAKDPAIVFIHGGPGWSAVDFELSGAPELAKKGRFVIVYDQRGQGRSKAATAENDFSTETYTRDLSAILQNLHLEKPTLIGHSFGGFIALKFLTNDPDRVREVVLVDAPISYPLLWKKILAACETIYPHQESLARDLMRIMKQPQNSDDASRAIGNFLSATLDCGNGRGLHGFKQAANKKAAKSKLGALPGKSTGENLVISPVSSFVKFDHFDTFDINTLPAPVFEKIRFIYGGSDLIADATDLDAIRDKKWLLAFKRDSVVLPNCSHSPYLDCPAEFARAVVGN